MRNIVLGVLLVSTAVVGAGAADTMEMKAQKMVKAVEDGCTVELGSFCKGVTPGEGRRLACLYAFEDQLTTQCEYALFNAASQLQQAVVKLQYVATECSNDIEKFCSSTAPGQGRILSCLKTNEKKVSAKCTKAVKETDLSK